MSEPTVLTKVAVRALADRLVVGREGAPSSSAVDPADVAACVAFVCAETRGMWHGRGRALMCRRLKHVALSAAQRDQLVEVIGKRLVAGQFSEQFRDQLRLALALDRPATTTWATRALQSEAAHARRLGGWTLRAAAARGRP